MESEETPGADIEQEMESQREYQAGHQEPDKNSFEYKKEHGGLIFGIDFDGTIVADHFPKMGREIPLATDTIRRLQGRGHKFILWTCRCGTSLTEAIFFLVEYGIVPDAINANIGDRTGYAVPKVYADVYLDDKSFPGFYGWESVREEFLPELIEEERKRAAGELEEPIANEQD